MSDTWCPASLLHELACVVPLKLKRGIEEFSSVRYRITFRTKRQAVRSFAEYLETILHVAASAGTYLL